jgi:hypothetical protein
MESSEESFNSAWGMLLVLLTGRTKRHYHSNRTFWANHWQPGSYQLARWVSTDKRASVYRTDQLSDGLKLGGNGVLGDPVQCRFLPRASELAAIDLATLRPRTECSREIQLAEK